MNTGQILGVVGGLIGVVSIGDAFRSELIDGPTADFYLVVAGFIASVVGLLAAFVARRFATSGGLVMLAAAVGSFATAGLYAAPTALLLAGGGVLSMLSHSRPAAQQGQVEPPSRSERPGFFVARVAVIAAMVGTTLFAMLLVLSVVGAQGSDIKLPLLLLAITLTTVVGGAVLLGRLR